MAEHDLRAEVSYGGQWNDHSTDVLTRQAVSISSGKTSEMQRTPPTTANVTFAGHAMNPRNPDSPLYQKFGRNTPLRLSLGTPHVAASEVDVTASDSHAAPSVDSPTDEALLLCCWVAGDDSESYTPPGTMTEQIQAGVGSGRVLVASEAISAEGPTGTRTATFAIDSPYLAVSLLLHGAGLSIGDVELASFAGLNPVTVEPGDWIVAFSSSSWTDFITTVGVAPLDIPRDSDHGGWIPLADTGRVEAAWDAAFDFLQLQAFAKPVKVAGEVTVDMERELLFQLGLDVATPILVVHGAAVWDIRAAVEVPSWPPRVDAGAADPRVPVAAAGVMRRLDRDRTPIRSTIHREVASAEYADILRAYWPCEDGAAATSIASAVIGGGAAMQILGEVDLAADSSFPGSQPLVRLGSGGRLRGGVAGMPDDRLFFRGLLAVPDGGLTDQSSLLDLVMTGGQVRRLRLRYGTGGSLDLRAYSADGALIDSTGPIATDVDGRSFFISVEAVEDGSDVDVLFHLRYVDGEEVEVGGVVSDTFAGTSIGPVHQVEVGALDGVDGLGVGHLMLGTSQALIFSPNEVLVGWAGEAAGVRVRRLCRENRVLCAIVGDPHDTSAMGPERSPATLPELLRDCEDADHGILFEPRQFSGTGYRTRSSLYNQQPVAAFDFSDIAPPIEPEPDDFLVANDITVTRPGGSSANVQRTEGPLNLNQPEDDPEGIGRVAASYQVRIRSDADLASHAGWLAHLLTTNDPRYPRLTLDLDANPDLAAVVARLDPGDRVTLDGLPVGMAPDLVSQLVHGLPETIGPRRRLLTLVSVPESPYRVFVLGDPVFGRLDTAGSGLAAGVDAAATEWLVATDPGRRPWVTTADHAGEFPFTLQVGAAETVTVTGIADAASPQTFTVTRGTLGTPRAWPAGTRVRLATVAVP